MNFFERALMYVAPGYATKRALRIEQAKFHLERISSARNMLRKYEAASKSSRLALWGASDGSANSEIRDSIVTLRARARDLVRNNPWAAHAVDVISTYVVGDGIRPQINHLENPDAKSIKRALDLWSDWAETTACDYDGERNLVQMQSAVMEAAVPDGDVFLIRHKISVAEMEKVKARTGIKTMVPLQLQLLEGDFLDHNRNEDFNDGRRIIQGVEIDKYGQRIAYHFFKSHPGETNGLWAITRDTVRIPADRVLPIFRKDRLHQVRGVTWFTRVMIRLKDLDIFEDASLRKQQIAACFSAFVIDASEDDEDDDDDDIELKSKLDSGTIERLAPGSDVKFAEPPSASDYPEFTKMQLRAIASGLGITYESLTQDLTGTNFSSGRMGHLGMARKVRKWQSQIIIAQMMDPVFVWWKEAADLVTPGNMDMSKLWSQWTTPAREMIDPGKEVSANSEAIESGQTTLSDVLRSQGKDPEVVFQERAAELKRMDELGIKKKDPSPKGKPGSSGGANKPNQEDEDENADAQDPNEDSAT